MKTLIAFISCLVLLASCQTPRYVYAPSPPNNPYFKEKGDSKIAAYISGGSGQGDNSGQRNRGFDLQAAYALTDHFAIAADHFSRKETDVYDFYERNIFDNSKVDYSRHITSIGAGYIVAMHRRKKITFNLYGGVGLGKFMMNDHGLKDSLPYTRFHNTNVTKWYLQPGFNFMPGNYFWCSFTTRYVFAQYSHVATNYTDTELDQLNLLNLGGRTLYFLEPSFNMLIGIKKCPWMKINAGFSFSANITSVSNVDFQHYDSRVLTGSIGLSFDLSKLNKK